MLVNAGIDNFYFTDEELRDSPSRKHGIGEQDETTLRNYGAQLIQEAGILLRCPQAVMATGQVLLQRYYCKRSLKDYSIQKLAAAATYLALKLEEWSDKAQVHQVIQVFDRLWQRRDGIPPSRLRVMERGTKDYNAAKESIIKYERDILREFGFIVHCDHPHKLLISFVAVLGGNQELRQLAWNVANDSLRTTLCVRFRSEAVAAGAIFYAARRLQFPLPDDLKWWEIFSVKTEQLVEVVRTLDDLYHQPKACYINVHKDATLMAGPVKEAPLPAVESSPQQATHQLPLDPGAPPGPAPGSPQGPAPSASLAAGRIMDVGPELSGQQGVSNGKDVAGGQGQEGTSHTNGGPVASGEKGPPSFGDKEQQEKQDVDKEVSQSHRAKERERGRERHSRDARYASRSRSRSTGRRRSRSTSRDRNRTGRDGKEGRDSHREGRHSSRSKGERGDYYGRSSRDRPRDTGHGGSGGSDRHKIGHSRSTEGGAGGGSGRYSRSERARSPGREQGRESGRDRGGQHGREDREKERSGGLDAKRAREEQMGEERERGDRSRSRAEGAQESGLERRRRAEGDMDRGHHRLNKSTREPSALSEDSSGRDAMYRGEQQAIEMELGAKASTIAIIGERLRQIEEEEQIQQQSARVEQEEGVSEGVYASEEIEDVIGILAGGDGREEGDIDMMDQR